MDAQPPGHRPPPISPISPFPRATPPPGDGPPPPFPPAPPPPRAGEANTWDMLCHLSALSGLFFPLGNVFGPLLVWLLKREEFPTVDAQGKAALNFQITVVIALAVLALGCFPLWIFGFLLVPVGVVIGLAAIIFPIIAAVKASNGEPFTYPCSLQLVK